ncbi:MAG: hypothetical protein KIT58_07905 [Planctomycetota bacterium]|nr:hypothetical protein [Planctomycetota bacterium]
MGVDLVYTDQAGQVRSIPVATLDSFMRAWVQAARELGLVIVPRLAHGAKLDPVSARTLVPELTLLAEWAGQRNQIDLGRRVEVVVSELRRAIEAGVTDLSFG